MLLPKFFHLPFLQYQTSSTHCSGTISVTWHYLPLTYLASPCVLISMPCSLCARGVESPARGRAFECGSGCGCHQDGASRRQSRCKPTLPVALAQTFLDRRDAQQLAPPGPPNRANTRRSRPWLLPCSRAAMVVAVAVAVALAGPHVVVGAPKPALMLPPAAVGGRRSLLEANRSLTLSLGASGQSAGQVLASTALSVVGTLVIGDQVYDQHLPPNTSLVWRVFETVAASVSGSSGASTGTGSLRRQFPMSAVTATTNVLQVFLPANTLNASAQYRSVVCTADW